MINRIWACVMLTALASLFAGMTWLEGQDLFCHHSGNPAAALMMSALFMITLCFKHSLPVLRWTGYAR